MKKKLLCMLLAVLMVTVLLPVTAMADEPHTHDNITFTEWSSENSLPEGAGNYYLTKDIILSSVWNVPSGTTNLCLNGHEIKQTGNCRVIEIPGHSTLNLYDCSGEGKITGGKSGHTGGGVYVNNGRFTMNGGTISGNTAEEGGGVATRFGNFTMTGGKISDNTAASNGGGVYINGGSFTMNGGTISNNTAKRSGGGVATWYGNFTMNDGTISGNTAASNGGGVCVNGFDAETIFTMTGGIISGNTAANNGGGVYHWDGTVTLGGTAKIIDNMRIDDETIPQNLYIKYNNKIILGTGKNGTPAPEKGMDIGVTMFYNTGRFTTNGEADDEKYFRADNTAYQVRYNEGGYLEVVENLQVGSVNITPDSQIDPNNIVDATISPATGLTESNTELSVVIGMIGIAVIGLGMALAFKRKER